jgi:hypothetical protein
MAATIAANFVAAHPTPVGIVVALWPPVCLAITLELVALVAYPAKRHPIITHALPADAQPGCRHAPTMTAIQDQAPKAGEARHDTGTDNRHAVCEIPAVPAAETRGAPAAVPAGTNGHVPVQVPAVPAPDLPELADSTGHLPAADSGYGSGTKAGHEAGQSGHHGQVRTGRVPDGDILAWLRHQAGTTGRVPGRRKVIEKWALGSTRAERLREIVLDEAASNGPRIGG